MKQLHAATFLAVLGHLLTLTSAQAADAPQAKELTELAAQRVAAAKELTELAAQRVAAAKEFHRLEASESSAEPIASARRLLDIDRRVLAANSFLEAEKDFQKQVRSERTRLLIWLGKRFCKREEWAEAAATQTELTEVAEADCGKGDYRAVDARQDLLYLQKMARLSRDDAHELAKTDETRDYTAGLHARGKYRDAIPLASHVVDVQQRLLGRNNARLANSLDWLATLNAAEGNNTVAESLYLQALEIWKAAVGENHPGYAGTLNNLSVLCETEGDFARAEQLLQQSLKIRLATQGEKHADYASALNNIASLYQSQGNYPRAEANYRRALELRKEAFGEGHPLYAQSLSNLAQLYESEGDFSQAEPLCRKALEIRAKTPESPGYALSLNNLATLYQKQNDYARAEPLQIRAMNLRKKIFGENHTEYAASLNNLAVIYQGEKHYTQAESLYRQASRIYEANYGKRHRLYATSLDNLGSLYKDQGDFAHAEPLYRQALDIRGALGVNHPEYARSINNLAALYGSMGDYAQAKSYFQQATDIRRRSLGADHPEYAQSLNNLGLLYRVLGDYAQAEPLAREAVAIQLNHLESTALVQSPRQQVLMTHAARYCLDNYIALAAENNQFARQAYRQVLVWKGVVLRRERLSRLGAHSPDLDDLFCRLKQATEQFARQAWSVPDPEQAVAWRAKVERLSGEKERLESELLRRSATFRKASQRVALEDIQNDLAADMALVDFLEYDHFIPIDKNRGAKDFLERRLIAFIVRRDGPVVLVNLGPAEPLARAITDWRSEFGASPRSAAAGRLLREKIWEPIEGKLRGATTILISPDGSSARLPFAALPGKESDTFLIEQYRFALVPAAQILPELLPIQAGAPAPPDLLLIGNVDFNRGGETGHTPHGDEFALSSTARRAIGPFRQLAGTESEVMAIADICQHSASGSVTTLAGSSAGKPAVLAEFGRHRYLHMATHGFFVQENVALPALPDRSKQGLFGGMSGQTQVALEYPSLVSGLALAGANRMAAMQNSPVMEASLDDGLLTAEEIASSDLGAVELVVLSACETGLGKSAAGEGLLGLQRSFQAAGARTVVASLWQVNDDATRRLMVEFYSNLWQKKLSRLDALRQAQLTMLHNYNARDSSSRVPDVRNPKPLPARSRTVSPYFWAAFVLSGDWR